MCNGTGSLPDSGSSSLQSYGDGQSLPEKAPVLSGNTCPVCRKTFERLYNLKVHLRKHTGETPYDCPIKFCKKQFKWRSSMAHHVRAHHDVSETIGIEVKCHARKRNTNFKGLNTDRQPANHSLTTSALGLASTRVKKSAKKKVGAKGVGTEGPPEGGSLLFPTQHHAGVSVLPQWGVEPSQNRNIPGCAQSIDSIEAVNKVPEYERHPGIYSPFVQSKEKLSEREDETKNKDDQLFEMVSEIFSRSTDMLQNYEETIPQIHDEVFSDSVDSGLMFLADGSEDATDAEMEARAHCGENLCMSSSKETNASPEIPF